MQCCFAVLRFQRIQISNQLLASSKSKIIKVYESFLSNILILLLVALVAFKPAKSTLVDLKINKFDY